MQPVAVEQVSEVSLPAPAVWDRVTTPAGIRHELRPLLSMTMPPGLRGRSLGDAAALIDRPLGKAWLLLFGLLPVEYDDMRIVALEPGRRFHEQSTMLLLSHWEHERTISALDAGTCEVRDRLTFLPRVLAGRTVVRKVAGWVVSSLFAHRHRRLRSWAADQTEIQ